MEELVATLNTMLSQLEDATRKRKELEEIIEFCQHWFKQADINLAVEIRNSTTPEILVEHIMVVRKFDFVKNLATNNWFQIYLF